MNKPKHYTTLLIGLLLIGILPLALLGQQKNSPGGKLDGNMAKCLPGQEGTVQLGAVTLPANLQLVNQEGQPTNLAAMMRGKVVAMNFIFTTCKTICPPMGANFVNLKKQMAPHLGKELVMLTVTIDPETDTPDRLKAWSNKFNGGPGWTLLTGTTQEVHRLLKALKVFTPLIEAHAPIIMMGREGHNNWVRGNALAPAGQLAATLKEMINHQHHNAAAEPAAVAPAAIKMPRANTAKASTREQADRQYFTDTPLLNQHGQTVKFYTDVLKGKTVVIIPFFTECTGTCPIMNRNIQYLQQHLGDRLGHDVAFVSLSVDPEVDQPEVLKAYAESYGAGPGWHFLTGTPANVRTVLAKLGNAVTSRNDHKNIMLMGNVPTRLWKKANGVAPAEQIAAIFDTVLANQLESARFDD